MPPAGGQGAEQWQQQVQTAGNPRGELPSPRQPLWLIFRYCGGPCYSVSIELRLPVLRLWVLPASPLLLLSNPRVHGELQLPLWQSAGVGGGGGRNKGRTGRLLPKRWGTHTQPAALVIREALCETTQESVKLQNYKPVHPALRFCPTHNLPQTCFLCHRVGNFHSALNPSSPIPSRPHLLKNCSSSMPSPGVRAVKSFHLKVGKKTVRKTNVTHCSMWFT